MKKIISNYFDNNNIIFLDRAFLGLYSIFKFIKENSKKDKVLFTSITCPSPVLAADFAGLTPIFTDINSDNFLMDFNEVKNEIKNRDDIAAVVYIYIFGHASQDVFKVKDLLENKDIYLIEDVAQAFDAQVGEQKVGTIGDASVFSFGYSKQIEAGSGGLMFLNSSSLDKKKILDISNDIQRFDVDSNMQMKYKKEFYNLRKKVLKNRSNYKLYNNFFKKYKKLYFKKINVDWKKVESKLINFLDKDLKKSRNKRAFKYHNGLKKINYDSRLTLPDIKITDSIYRYTFLVNNKKNAQKLSTTLRENEIHCSNLYLPVSRFYNNSNFVKAVNFSERVINLWVDNIADENYINKTLKVIESFLN